MAPSPAAPLATVGVVTRDRQDLLRVAIDSCLAQDAPIEVVVLDDGSTDGTSEMVARDYPGVRLIREESSRGYIDGRMRLVRDASSEIVFFLDDDAYFSTPRVVRQTLRDFDHPRIAVVAVPTSQDGQILQGAPGSEEFRLTHWSFGCATALKRTPVLEIGGLRTTLGFFAEEPDLALRLLDRGYVVREGRSDPIVHVPAPGRNWPARFSQMTKSLLVYRLYTAPALFLPLVFLMEVVRSGQTAVKGGWYGPYLKGIGRGVAEVVCHLDRRTPVMNRTFWAWMTLSRHRPLLLSRIESLLPELPAES